MHITYLYEGDKLCNLGVLRVLYAMERTYVTYAYYTLYVTYVCSIP